MISKEAAEHKAEFRVRCNKCDRIFCSSCKVSPYHVGHTCQQYKENLVKIKCKYCKDYIEEFKGDIENAFCDKPDCQ